ncbi:MAG TPA: hypothetical protein VGN76_04250 [Gemmatimonadales bacterium]|nr:hypothetical protein [Gemmatimonadales bacterium]
MKSAITLSSVAAALICSGSSELGAQEVHLRPQLGLYLPTKVSIQDGVLHIRQKVSVKAGARLTLSFNDRFDVVTGVTYLPGYAIFHRAGEEFEVATGAHVLTATTGAQYWLVPPAKVISWEVHSGIGLVFGGQPARDELFASSTATGILGTTLRYRIGQIVRLHLRIQDRIYRFRSGAPESGRPRRPLQVSFGVGFPFLESLR